MFSTVRYFIKTSLVFLSIGVTTGLSMTVARHLFDGLVVGETFQLINDHEPRPLFYQFQFERPGQYEWAYEEQGPAVWRVNITKVK
jgi:uncharacterized protein (DUF2249 family)